MNWILVLYGLSTIACAVVAGVFLTFSEFIMRALKNTSGSGGIEAMRLINRYVFKTIFMVQLIGMSALSPLLVGLAYLTPTTTSSLAAMAGGAIYFVGTFGVTLFLNVPMNNRLEALAPESADAAAYWQETYLPKWTFWNSVRTTAAALSSICFLIATINAGITP